VWTLEAWFVALIVICPISSTPASDVIIRMVVAAILGSLFALPAYHYTKNARPVRGVLRWCVGLFMLGAAIAGGTRLSTDFSAGATRVSWFLLAGAALCVPLWLTLAEPRVNAPGKAAQHDTEKPSRKWVAFIVCFGALSLGFSFLEFRKSKERLFVSWAFQDGSLRREFDEDTLAEARKDSDFKTFKRAQRGFSSEAIANFEDEIRRGLNSTIASSVSTVSLRKLYPRLLLGGAQVRFFGILVEKSCAVRMATSGETEWRCE